MSKSKNKNYPGSQSKLRSFNLVFFLLALLTTVFFLLTIYSVLRDNYLDKGLVLSKFLQFSILDTKTACTIFVSFISIVLVRHHFIVGFKPKIIYECKKTKVPYNAELENGKILWQVKIKNVGLGTAIFTDYSFRANVEEIKDSSYNKTFVEVIDELKAHSVFYEDDYYISNITNGYAMPSKEERVVFEVLLPIGFRIKQVDVKMRFEGYLGGLYEKEVYCIPRIGIYNKSLHKPQENLETDMD